MRLLQSHFYCMAPGQEASTKGGRPSNGENVQRRMGFEHRRGTLMVEMVEKAKDEGIKGH